MSRVNFSGRIRIPHRAVQTGGKLIDRAPSATVELQFDGLRLDESAEVYIEFFRRSTLRRFSAGTVENPHPVTYDFVDFGSHEGVLVRVKVVCAAPDEEGKLIGVADKVRIDWEPLPGQTSSLLPFRAEESLGSVVWDLELGDEPVVLVNARLDDWNTVARSPWFVALVYPEVLYRIALWVLEADPDEECPAREWAAFFENLVGQRPPYGASSDEAIEWGQLARQAFACQHKMLARVPQEGEDGS